MPQAISTTFAARLFDRERLDRIADGLAVALAVSLPWSTSATGILAALWFIAVLPTLDFARLRQVALSPAGGLPIVFALLALLGVLWSEASWRECFAAVVPYARMLAIPLLICQFSRSPRGVFVIYGLIASGTVLLIVSYWSYWFDGSIWYPFRVKQVGVPLKNYIIQSAFFTICAFTLIEMATERWRAQQRRIAAGLLLLALAFLANIALVATGRTALLVIAVLLALYALRQANWKAAIAVIAVGIALAGAAWLSSDYLRKRVVGVFTEIHDYSTQNKSTSSGQRIEMWRNSVKLVAQAPIVGYGTGALATTLKSATRDNLIIPNGDNPHNQTFTVAIQLGLAGVIVLYALWLSHFLKFRGAGWAAWFGTVVVVQIVVGSLVNSYLFDFEAGWTYAVCVGVAGGIVQRRNAAATTRHT